MCLWTKADIRQTGLSSFSSSILQRICFRSSFRGRQTGIHNPPPSPLCIRSLRNPPFFKLIWAPLVRRTQPFHVLCTSLHSPSPVVLPPLSPLLKSRPGFLQILEGIPLCLHQQRPPAPSILTSIRTLLMAPSGFRGLIASPSFFFFDAIFETSDLLPFHGHLLERHPVHRRRNGHGRRHRRPRYLRHHRLHCYVLAP